MMVDESVDEGVSVAYGVKQDLLRLFGAYLIDNATDQSAICTANGVGLLVELAKDAPLRCIVSLINAVANMRSYSITDRFLSVS